MSYRKMILKRLRHFYNDIGSAEGAYLQLDPIDIVGKPLTGKDQTKYIAAINQLLREGIIKAASIGGQAAFTLDSSRIGDVKSELEWWRKLIVLVPILIALAGLIWGVVAFFLRR